MKTRRQFIQGLFAGSVIVSATPMTGYSSTKNNNSIFKQGFKPTQCCYSPDGEYIKDHSFIFHDGWWHLFSISGTAGYYHGNNGNEETISWSISKDLVNWEMRGHIMHASLREGSFDQHEVWAPYVLKANGKFYMFYTGIIHPHRPLTYGKPGPDHKWIYEGHQETQGLAISTDLTDWTKVSDLNHGINIPGRDSHVVWNTEGKEWLLYTTGPTNSDGLCQAFVSRSKDLLNWDFWGVCALFPRSEGSAESLTVMKHPVSHQWIIMGNSHYALSDNPLSFPNSRAETYLDPLKEIRSTLGFACETIEYNGKWYRSGVFGDKFYFKLGFTEIEWMKEGAFAVKERSVLAAT